MFELISIEEQHRFWDCELGYTYKMAYVLYDNNYKKIKYATKNEYNLLKEEGLIRNIVNK